MIYQRLQSQQIQILGITQTKIKNNYIMINNKNTKFGVNGIMYNKNMNKFISNNITTTNLNVTDIIYNIKQSTNVNINVHLSNMQPAFQILKNSFQNSATTFV